MAHSRTRISPRIQLQTARDAGIRLRAEEIGREELDRVRARRQKIFGRFLLLEWVLAVAIAVVWAPLTWLGRLDLGLALQAIVYGGAVNALVVAVRPLGPAAIRRVMVVGQMLLAALFVHVLGGRDEVFAVAFMALALIAAFRDRALLHLGLVVGLGVGLVHTEVWPEELYRARGPDRDEIAAFAALLIAFWAVLTSSLDHTLAESAES
ncbi:MAG: hypothetical protein JNJ59_07325, partial [Deltaproteobacteria bacterium]|nr:hypothetical protein [Deltaproteobacteria bacterium]